MKQSLKIKLNDEDKELLGINDNNDSIINENVNENVNENSDTYTDNATDVVDATDTVDEYKFYNNTYSNNEEESNLPNVDLEKKILMKPIKRRLRIILTIDINRI